MGILRTDIISHSQLEGSGSVEFDGDGDSLTFTATSALSLDSDFTIEFYIFNNTIALDTQHPSPVTMPAESGHNSQIYTNSFNNYYGLYKQADIVTTGNNSALTGVWQHVAFTRKGSICFAFLDGVLKNTAVSTVIFGGTSGTYRLGSYTEGGGNVNGFISNLRIIKGTAIYTANFTSPKFELKNIAGTSLLGCQSTTSATDFAVTPNTITAINDAAASSFHPGLKKDITDTGVVFDGVTNFDSQAFMVPPSGKTSERNRGRALFGGGSTIDNTIQSLNIQSQGNAEDFGDLSTGRYETECAASSTRGIWAGGYTESPNVKVNIIEFVTIAVSSNTTDFGDLTLNRGHTSGASNATRGVIAGGTAGAAPHPVTNVIDFFTIATTGNASDFGDTTSARKFMGGGRSSTTRALFCGGNSPETNAIDFVTIATTGNAQDFGDCTQPGWAKGAGNVSSGTRAVLAGGYASPTNINVIEFLTIATLGNGTDFGDLAVGLRAAYAAGSKTRGIFGGGKTNPANATTNTISFVTIATTGDAQDFGDMITSKAFSSGLSDCHGGLE